MAVNTVKVAILVSRSLLWISLQLASERQGSFVLNLHQDLVDQGSQRSETHEFSRGDLERLSSHCSPVLAIFRPLSCHTSSCLSLFLHFFSRASNASSAFMYLVALYSTFSIVFESFLYRKSRSLHICSLFMKATTSILSSASSIEKASLLKQVM